MEEKKEGRASRAKLGEVTQWRQTVLCCTLAGGSGGFSRQLILARGYQEGTKSVRGQSAVIQCAEREPGLQINTTEGPVARCSWKGVRDTSASS